MTLSAFSLNKVSTPPRDCCNPPPSVNEEPINLPIAATVIAPLIAVTILPPADLPAEAVSPDNSFSIDPFIPFAEGIICT